MAIYNSKLLSKKQIADGTMEFILEKPADFKYRAGQFFDILLEKSSPEAKKSSYVHGFSFVSAPFEEHLVAATRMRDSDFKNAIKALPDNSPVQLDACFGNFTLPKDTATPIVYIIGGIGITPVRSMVAQATHDKTEHQLTLIFANKKASYAPFISDLTALAQQNKNFKFVQTYTDEQVDGCEHGRVTIDMVRKYVSDINKAVYYLSGPAGMVRSSRELLMAAGVDEDNIRTEEFDGY